MTSTNLETHLKWLLDRLDMARLSVRNFVTDRHFEADFFCFWESATGNGGPEFGPELLGRISTLGVPLGLDIYFSDEPLPPIYIDGKTYYTSV